MSLDCGSQPDGRDRRESALVDGLLQDGNDRLASWRAHSRDVTTARQAAEQRYARTEAHRDAEGPESPEVAVERAAAFQAELARINAEDRLWMREHGIDEVEPAKRRRRPRGGREAVAGHTGLGRPDLGGRTPVQIGQAPAGG